MGTQASPSIAGAQPRQFYDEHVDFSGAPGEDFKTAIANVARIGIQDYPQLDGTVRREYRPAEEVFKEDSYKTLIGKPVTLLHPDPETTGSNLVNSGTYRRVTIGSVSDVWVDGQYIKAKLHINDAQGLIAIRNGVREVSCGYTADLDVQPGEFQGERYDAIQRNIKLNHVALVPRGRAGPEVRLLKVDTKEDNGMAKMKIGDEEFEVDQKVSDAFKKMSADMEKMKSDMDKAKPDSDEKKDGISLDAIQARADVHAAEVTSLKADNDSLKAKLDAAEKAAADALKGEAFTKAVNDRLELVRCASGFLKDAKLDEMSDVDIKRSVILAKSPSMKLDGKSDDYIAASFDTIVAGVAKADENAQKQASHLISGEPAQRTDAQSARQRYIDRLTENSRKKEA